ncbi:hypothetical protein SOVF_214960 [Spinacia oleracea]|nr:hypothetical protein SOVF_214960 [Spinacia oleracea]
MEKCRSYPNYGKYEVQYEDEEIKRSSSKSKSKAAYNFNGPSGSNKLGSSGDPESKRKKRVASYNMFSVEGKLKSSVKNGFKWIKNKITDPNSHAYQDS